MFDLDFKTNFKVGDIVKTHGEDKLMGGYVKQELVEIIEVKTGPFKYNCRYVSDGKTCLFMEDELVPNLRVV